MKLKPQFNVLIYDNCTNKFEPYNIFPYLISAYKHLPKQKRPKTLKDVKDFIIRESRYQWWGRCEYEMILSSWPTNRCEEKWDIHMQIMMNIDLIAEMFFELSQKRGGLTIKEE